MLETEFAGYLVSTQSVFRQIQLPTLPRFFSWPDPKICLNGVSIIIDKSVLLYIKGSDHDVLGKALSAKDTSPYLKDLSVEFKSFLFAICGADSVNLLGLKAGFPKRHLKLNHLEQRPIEFYLKDKSQLP